MPVKFSELNNISKDVIQDVGVFDVILDVDSRVFIDPAMLVLCDEPEFIHATEKVEKYFKSIITLLKHSNDKNDMYWKKADQMLRFHEITGTCFGYSQNGTGGNAIGSVLRNKILETVKSLIQEGEEDPCLFEILGVFQEGIGCDRISDLITFILRHDIMIYTQRIIHDLGISFEEIAFEGEVYKICKNPFSGQALLLLPEVILSPLPLAESFSDIDFVVSINEEVRIIVNRYFDFGDDNRIKLTKKDLSKIFLENDGFRRAFLSAYRRYPRKSYDFMLDPMGEYIWLDEARKITAKYPVSIECESVHSVEEVMKIVKQICYQFKALIENNSLCDLLYDADRKPKHESAAQLLFYGVADSYCLANGLDLTREANGGRGPCDFKVSDGLAKVVVETKLTSNKNLKHGIEKQLPVYMKAEKAIRAIYLIIDNGHPRALESFEKWYGEYMKNQEKSIPYIVVDAIHKESASNVTK